MPRFLRPRAGRRPTAATPATPIQVHASDDQDEVPDLDLARYARLVSDALTAEGVHGPGEANLLFVDRDAMTQLNRLHMGTAGPTDVLSFPLDGADALSGPGHRMVGDLVVCPSVAAEQAEEHAGTFDDEVALLVVHGSLHLCGHDHAEPDEREVMWRRERDLLDRWWGPLARDPWVATA